MSSKEISKLEIMQRLKEKSLSQQAAAKMLNVSVRQVKRMFKAYREKGVAGLISQQRGRVSNNRLSEKSRVQALDLLGSKYRGFGPTLACEKLVEAEGLKISRESVRKMMLVAGLWKARRVRKVVTHQMREHRPCLGELVQIDGSPHDWFEGRVERANQTLQDRLPKELRLRGISTWEAGNAYLPEFMADFNRRFAVQPISQHDAHRHLTT